MKYIPESKIKREVVKYRNLYECIEKNNVFFCYDLDCFEKKEFEARIICYDNYKILEGAIKGRYVTKPNKVIMYVTKSGEIDDILNMNNSVLRVLSKLLYSYCNKKISLEDFQKKFFKILNYTIKQDNIDYLIRKMLSKNKLKVEVVVDNKSKNYEKIKDVLCYI